MSEMKTINWRIVAEDGRIILSEEPYRLSRLFAVGQSLTENFIAYEVVKNEVTNSLYTVTVNPVGICRRCGGIKGKTSPPDECLCG